MWFLRIFHIVSKLPVKRVLAFSQKRQSNGLFSAFKIVLSCAIGLTLSMVMFTLLFSNDDNVGYTRSVKETKQHFLGLKFVKPKPKVKKFKNHKGKINGLNLLLIDNIQTEGYVKEYLTIAKQCQEGKLSEDSQKATVEEILGFASSEQGLYDESNGSLPVSMLPWDSSKNSPKWDKDAGITLSQVGYNQYTLGGGSLGYYRKGWGAEDAYCSPFQLSKKWFAVPFGGSGAKPNILYNPTGTSAGRGSDGAFFPDDLATINWQLTGTSNWIDFSNLTSPEITMSLVLFYNMGQGASDSQVFHALSPKNPQTRAETMKKIGKLFAEIQQKYGNTIVENMSSPDEAKFAVAMILFYDYDFKFDTNRASSREGMTAVSKIRTNRGASEKWLKLLYPDKSFSQYLSDISSKGYSSPNPQSSTYSWNMDGVYDGQDLWGIGETWGYMFTSSVCGAPLYARMLKFAGVDVDPTNPATYMTMVGAEEEDEDGEGDTWTPDGEEIKWMLDAGVDVSKLSPDRVKALNYAHQYIGLPYKWGGTNPNTDGGLDCSGFVQWTMKNAMGKSNFGRNTIAQEQEGHEIPWSEARPGDLLFFGSHGSTHHVAFYLSGTNKSDVVYMDEPRTDKTCQVAKGATWESGSVWVLRLDNVYDDSIHYASNVDDNSGIQGGDLGAVGSTKNIDGKEFEVLPRNLIVPIPKSSYPSPMFSQQFGVPQSWNGKYHAGDDIPVHDGTPVYAADDGVVIKSVDLEESYGHHIIIRDDNSHTHTVYGHLTTRLVQKGDRVKRGQKIGISGHTGNVRPKGPDGAHLHFEVRDMDNWGVPVDPFKDPGKRLTFGDMNYVDRSNGKLYKEKSTGLW